MLYKKIKYIFFLGIICFLTSTIASAQSVCTGNVLLLGENTSQGTDSALREHIVNTLGLTLDYKGSEEAAPEDILAGAYDLVIISNSLSSSVAESYVDLEIPLINLEGWALDGLKMVKAWEDADVKAYNNLPYNSSNENSFNSLVVSNSDTIVYRGLDAGFAGDTIPVFTANVPYQNNQHPAYLAIPNDNAYPILEYTESTMIWLAENDPEICGTDYCLEQKRYAAFVYDKGVEMEYDFVAPEKRGFFFFHTHTAAVVTSEVWEIFNAMVYWGLGCLDRPEITGINNKKSAEYFPVKLYPNPTHGILNVEIERADAQSSYTFQVFTLTGESVYRSTFIPSETKTVKITLSDLKPGTYFLSVIEDKAQRRTIQKITFY